MEEHVKISLDRYSKMTDNLRDLKNKNDDVVKVLVGFIMSIKDEVPYLRIVNKITDLGYSLLLSSNGVITKIGEGEKIISIKG